ncbi:hypothetical protein KR059_012535 [Drosophila kikkawai]|nr:hypothetical protein KR059_012535 [Drosophila kikkawai]
MSASNKPDDSTNPMEVLTEGMKKDDVHLRLISIRKLSSIALILGAERTRSEMLPFIKQILLDADMVILSVAEQLGNFTSLVGGPEFANLLLPPLEFLATVKDDAVRYQAVQSLRIVVAKHSAQDMEIYVVPMLQRLASDVFFTSRTSACCFFSICYPRVTPPVKAKLRTDFRKLCLDESPVVRGKAASELGEFAKVIETEFVRLDVIPDFLMLAQDDTDTVRSIMVKTCISLAQVLLPEEVTLLVWPTLRDYSRDTCWRVRLMLAQNLVDLQKAVSPIMSLVELLSIFQTLLKDTDAGVRIGAAVKIKHFCGNLDKANQVPILVNCFMPFIQNLVSDTSAEVKATMALVVLALSQLMGSTLTMEKLMPLLHILVKDTCPEVRLDVISNLNWLDDVIGIQQLSVSLLPVIIELAEDSSWQVRLAVIDYMPNLAAVMGQEFFDQKLRCLCMGWLTDRVYAVREAGVINMRKLILKFGASWATKSIIPLIMTMSCNDIYLYRMTCLFCVNELAMFCGMDTATNIMLPTVLLLSEDPIANVRFNVAKTLKKIFPFLEASVMDAKVKPALDKLRADEDVDVQNFAADAIAALPAA